MQKLMCATDLLVDIGAFLKLNKILSVYRCIKAFFKNRRLRNRSGELMRQGRVVERMGSHASSADSGNVKRCPSRFGYNVKQRMPGKCEFPIGH